MMMKARHLFAAHSGNVTPPREKSRPAGNMLQMKRCNENILSRMAEVPLFAGLPDSERTELVSELDVRVREYRRDEVIVHECDPASEIVVVLKGRVAVYENGLRPDRRHLAYFLHPGETYGTSFPVLELETSPALLMAKGKVEILFCRVSKVRDLIRRGSHSGFVVNLYAATARQGFAAWRKLTLISCYEIADRVQLFLSWRRAAGHSDSALPPLSEFSEYLGVNRTSLYRVIAKAGIVEEN